MTSDIADLLRAQWTQLRRWLGEVDLDQHGGRPTGLGTWTVSDLVAHLGLGLRLMVGTRAADDDAEPVSLGRYVAAYPPSAAAIAEETDALAGELGPDVLTGLDAIAEEAWAALETLRAPVLLGRRGPITRRDYLMTRLLELVIHADDLERAVPPVGWTPIHDEAADEVAEALADAYEERGGRRPDVSPPLPWIRRAAGRVGTEDPLLPLL